MTLRIGFVMDPIQTITPYKDTTLAMMLEAQARGWELRYMETRDLYVVNGVPHAYTRSVTVRDDNKDWHTLGPSSAERLTTLDAVLMRKDPPVDNDYLYATYMLELAEIEGVLVLNRPQGLRDANEKLFATRFPQCCAPTLVTAERDTIKRFVEEHGKAVLKPLHGMGGASIFVVPGGDPNTNVIIETLTDHGRRHIMVQRYLPEISSGDKRILVIDGEPVPYALARIPMAGETRGNIAAGGRGEGRPLTERDRWICSQVAPTLKSHGLTFVGLDVIGDYLTEVNVTSPTCVRELDQAFGLNISAQFLDVVESRVRGAGRA